MVIENYSRGEGEKVVGWKNGESSGGEVEKLVVDLTGNAVELPGDESRRRLIRDLQLAQKFGKKWSVTAGGSAGTQVLAELDASRSVELSVDFMEVSPGLGRRGFIKLSEKGRVALCVLNGYRYPEGESDPSEAERLAPAADPALLLRADALATELLEAILRSPLKDPPRAPRLRALR